MSELEELRKAYFVLGLEPGTNWDAIVARYKRCTMVWHPDRTPDDPAWKAEATEELKKLNRAKDVLQAHFMGGVHKPDKTCICYGGLQNSIGGEEARRREEAEAKRRDAERAKQTFGYADQDKVENASKKAMQEALEQNNLLKQERLRWQIAAGLGMAYVALCIFGWLGVSAKTWWHDVSWRWEQRQGSK
jgi:hypothetical protein